MKVLLAIAVAFGLLTGLLGELRGTAAENCGCSLLVSDCCCASEQDAPPAQPAQATQVSLEPKQVSQPARVVIATLPTGDVKVEPRAESCGAARGVSARMAALCVRTI